MKRTMKLIAVAPKRFYTPKEMAEFFGMEEEKILRFAYLCGALYLIERIRLIHRETLENFVIKFEDYVKSADGTYISVNDAVKAMGITQDAVMQIIAGAGAAYQIGRYTLINVAEAEEYIHKFRIDIAPIDVEEELEYERRMRHAKD